MSEHSIRTIDAARRGAAVISRADRAHIVVSGADRRTYLNGLLTNDTASLGAGEGVYAAYLTAQGRMIADLWVYELGDVILLALHKDAKDTVLARLDQFVFSEDVQLGDVTETFDSVAVVGPRAAAVVSRVVEGVADAELESFGRHAAKRISFGGEPAIVLRVSDPGAPGFDLIVARAQRAALDAALQHAGAEMFDAAASEALRIEAGVPKWRQDMDEDTIPLEAGIEAQAISLTKGCYVGQEVIIRVLHRGHGRVVRKLVGLTIESTGTPGPGTPVTSVDGREIGRVTSSTFSPSLAVPIALGYVHRDFVDAGTAVLVGGAPARVTALPFAGQ
jgi:folate-binding protein YgfZ